MTYKTHANIGVNDKETSQAEQRSILQAQKNNDEIMATNVAG